MLDRTQVQLLDLLKEIDDICRENDITYFLDGGTVIGGARHDGFIPWDNDADIGMTEENYNKFAEVVNKRTKETHRIVQDITLNPEYPLEIGRYVNLDMTKITRTSAFWNVENSMAGLMIDVFKLIPLPKDPVEKAKRWNLLNVYAEYCNESNRRSGRREDAFDSLYRKVRIAGAIFGKARVKAWMEKQLFNKKYADDEYDSYLYCAAGIKVPRQFPKEMYDDEPIRVKFENLELPITPHYHEYLRVFYGEDYWKIPIGDGQVVHAPINSEYIPARYYVKDYMRLMDETKLKASRKSHKEAHVKLARLKKKASRNEYGLAALAVQKQVAKRIKEEGIDLAREYENHNWELLNDLFEGYYELQFSAGCKYWPIFVELTEEQLYYAAMTLITQKENISRAGWILKSYRECVSPALPPMLAKVQLLLDSMFKARSCYDYNRDEEGMAALEEGLREYPDDLALNCWKLMYESKHAEVSAEDELMAHVDAMLEKYPGRPEVLKAKGDFLWRMGRTEEAAAIYDDIYDRTRDGMLRLDIERKRRG